MKPVMTRKQKIGRRYPSWKDFFIEGAASVGIAALTNNLVDDLGKEVVTIIRSRNINMDVLYQILCRT